MTGNLLPETVEFYVESFRFSKTANCFWKFSVVIFRNKDGIATLIMAIDDGKIPGDVSGFRQFETRSTRSFKVESSIQVSS